VRVAALFVERLGAYYGLPDVDPWDVRRDARRYAGPWPVVAHPPCARWSRLAGLVEHRWGQRRGADGGCFRAALNAVRRWGGVLEHPAESAAWRAYGLPPPTASGWAATPCGGWVCLVEQGHYGHLARKATWLYVAGVERPPELVWGPSDARLVVASTKRSVRRELIPKRLRSATPERFRGVLLAVARSAQPNPGAVVLDGQEPAGRLPLFGDAA
jgi:hypothetical protein